MQAAKAGKREWIGLGVLALPCILYAMDLTVLNLAGPKITADLHPSSEQLLWIMDVYGFVLAGSLMTMGSLGDRIGRRRLLLGGAIAFGLASVLAASSSSVPMLIAARALMGIAGATLAPSTLSLVRNLFLDDRQRTLAISIWASSYSVGAAVGPLIGGFLLERFWWGSVFLLAVPVMGLLLALGPALLPEFREPAPGRIDALSAVLSLAGILLTIHGLKELAANGPSREVALSVTAGLVLSAIFIRRQRGLAQPFLDLTLFRAPAFSVALASTTLGLFVAFGLDFFVAQQLQLVMGLSVLQAGLWTTPPAGAMIVGPLLVPLLVRRMRPSLVMAAGLAVTAAGCLLLSQAASSSSLALLIAASFLVFLGVAPAVTLATDLVVASAPVERAGSASATSETSFEMGGALGIAVLGSIGAAVYRNLLPEGALGVVPQSLVGTAHANLAGAVAVAGQLPGQPAGALLSTAQAAFVHGFQAAALAGAAIALAAAIASGAVGHARITWKFAQLCKIASSYRPFAMAKSKRSRISSMASRRCCCG